MIGGSETLPGGVGAPLLGELVAREQRLHLGVPQHHPGLLRVLVDRVLRNLLFVVVIILLDALQSHNKYQWDVW